LRDQLATRIVGDIVTLGIISGPVISELQDADGKRYLEVYIPDIGSTVIRGMDEWKIEKKRLN
jgi:hypothetical protein